MQLWSDHILPLLLLLTLFTSCSQEEDIAFVEKEICFYSSSSTPVVTRSSDTEELPTNYKMWVAAIYHDQYNTNHRYYFGATIEKRFAWDNYLLAWKGIEDHYYPLSGTMDFLAYAIQKDEHKPTPTYTPSTLSAAANTFSTLTLDFGIKLDGTDPVVFSDLRQNIQCGSVVTKQNLHFRHAMAKIVFKALANDAIAQNRLIINQITINDVRTSGVLSVTPNPSVLLNDQLTGSIPTWTSTSNLTSISLLPANSALGISVTATEITSPIYLPTQSNSPQAVSVDLKYTILNGPSYTASTQRTMSITLPAVQWLPEHQYTYTLSCSLTQIKVTVHDSDGNAIIDNWTTNEIVSDELY